MKKLICLVGETARGKDTVARYLQEHYNMKAVVSHTTRPKRISETEGVEHYFIDDFTANKMLATTDNIAAYTKIGNYRYFSTIEEVIHSDIYIIDPNGLKSLYLGNNAVEIIPIYVTCMLSTARERALKRGDNLETFEERVIAELEQFKDFHDWIYRIDNDFSLKDLYKQVDVIMGDVSNSDSVTISDFYIY